MSVLSGPIGKDLNVRDIPKHVAYRYVKGVQIEYIKQDCSKAILDEINDTREILRDPIARDWHVSIVVPNSTNQNTFMVVYRMNDRFPKCYTVEAVVRNHFIEPGQGSMSILELSEVLNQMVKDRMGHLQLHSLKTWAGGRYNKELELEKKFVLTTFDTNTISRGHSKDNRDFRKFGFNK